MLFWKIMIVSKRMRLVLGGSLMEVQEEIHGCDGKECLDL